MAEPTVAYIGLGSNLGDRQRAIGSALHALGRTAGVDVVRVSDIRETAPLGEAPQSHYLNAVAEIATTLTPGELLKALKTIEDLLGRVRREKWGPRTIDLDLLLYGRENIRLPELIVPHPQMHLRSFVLDGLCQLDPSLVHPLFKETVSELAARLAGGDFALNSNAPQLVSVAGLIGVGKTTLAQRLAVALEGEILLEPYDTNPFLPQVYAGKKELALDSQLYFLVCRAAQLGADALTPGRIFLTDYVFEKELIYAQQLLNEDQFKLYEQIYVAFVDRVATPALVIYLQDSPEKCLERIHQRNRPYEQQIGLDFLKGLYADYEQLFGGWKKSPVVRISAEKVRPGDDAAVRHLALQVKAYVAASKASVANP
ncbi:MAG: 2-amino-4-hydroxy-6-hydroxymethyldihydropteridine diphosphokinase [Sedimentisphaerales bacterium]|nr:2-amino-4-hydroxy-6-hydroxymethyldihydropteridine diphosphokinase [Sedimentisphaerales bacterium]